MAPVRATGSGPAYRAAIRPGPEESTVMHRHPRTLAVAAALAAALLAGCGSSSGSSSDGGSDTSAGSGGRDSDSAQTIDVCKIVTASDAEKVIGGPVEEQAPAGTERLTSGVCIYRATTGGIRVSLLQVRVYPGPQFYGEDALPGAESIELEGTDKAFVRSSGKGRSIDVQFVKDGKTGTVNFTDTGTTNPSAEKSVETVAQTLADGI
jgi:hypothetical protein